jgi:beta-galactosidase
MKKIQFLILLATSAAALLGGPVSDRARAQAPDLYPRLRINFNREWKFQLGDHPGAEAAVFDDQKWQNIGLPHSFSEPYFLSAQFYTGYGWYRKHFAVPDDWSGKRINLDFDAAFQDAEIFVNGRRIGEHKGGYTGFTFDITTALHPGDNLVAVRLNNLWNPQLAPRAGEHVFSGGIYRDVWLVVTDPLHVTWYGTFVTTPQISTNSGTVNIKTEIGNDSTSPATCALTTDIMDPQGNFVTSVTSEQAVPAGATVTFDQTTPPVPHPQLWHPDHPFLYRAVSKLAKDGKRVDGFQTTFGFRWFKWTADQGFFLNGSHYYFKGVNVHQDHAGWGDAVADNGFYRDVKLVKDAGFDFIRGSHYPHAPAFAAACDQLGVLFWSENCFWGTAGLKNPWGSSAYPPEPQDQAGFEVSVKQSLRDEIRINRNHPSIVVWSMDNEVFFTARSTLPRVRNFLKDLVALTHQLDPTRPAAIGGCQRGDIDKLGDVAGYNGDGAYLFTNPGIANVVTEYGSTVADRPGDYAPGWGDLQSVEFPWRSGQALWCGFDHGSIAGHFGCMGMVDYFRLPKRQWYWYRNAYRNIPPPAWPQSGTPAGLLLTTDQPFLKSADGTEDAQIIVTVVDRNGTPLSNSPPVTLTIQSGPGEFPTGRAITFAPDSDIAIRDGQAAIECRAYYSGSTVIRATSPGLPDASLVIQSTGGPEFIAGKTRGSDPLPYVRFEKPMTATTNSKSNNIVFGRDNPTLASSQASGHPARLANDGAASTFWQAAKADTNAWWQVDLERLLVVQKVRLTFPTDGNHHYKIEVSPDQVQWKVFMDESRANIPGRIEVHSGIETTGRYLRVTLSRATKKQPASLAEVEVWGHVQSQ